MQVSLSKLSWKAQAGVFAAVSVLAVGGFYKYYVEPMQAEMAIREKKLAAMRVDINKGLATARRLAEFRKQVADFETRLDALRAVLPEEKDVGELLRRLQMLAAQANLQIKAFKPAPIVVKQMHAEWPINLQLEGTYHNLGHFFDEVGKFSRIININAIHIKAKDKSASGATISAECVATTFVMTEAPAKPAARQRPVRPALKKAD